MSGNDQTSVHTNLSHIAAGLRALREGNFDVRMWEGSADPQAIAVAREFNALQEMLAAFKSETMRVVGQNGTLGNLGSVAEVPDARGDWRTMVDHVNTMSQNLEGQFRNTAAVVTAIARGRVDLRVTNDAIGGEWRELRDFVNAWIDRLIAQRNNDAAATAHASS